MGIPQAMYGGRNAGPLNLRDCQFQGLHSLSGCTRPRDAKPKPYDWDRAAETGPCMPCAGGAG